MTLTDLNGVSYLSRESGLALIEDAQRWMKNYERERNAHLKTLVAFYHADYRECARVCDEVIDPSGALLGLVRDLAAQAMEGRFQ